MNISLMKFLWFDFCYISIISDYFIAEKRDRDPAKDWGGGGKLSRVEASVCQSSTRGGLQEGQIEKTVC